MQESDKLIRTKMAVEEQRMAGIPHDEICERGDRSWTMRLLEALKDPDLAEEERDEVVNSLQVVDDPRSIEPLTALLTDRSIAVEIREAAEEVLIELGQLPDSDTLVQWWKQGDETLRHAALWGFGAENTDIIIPIASDPEHGYHLEAIQHLHIDVGLPDKYQELNIRALSHPDPRVRKTATINLKWSELVKAEEALIKATRDLDTVVAVEACHALAYYPTQRALRYMKELIESHPNEAVLNRAQASFKHILNDLTAYLEGDNRKHMRQWLEPVWDILENHKEDQSVSRKTTTTEREEDLKTNPTFQEIIKVIENPDTALADIYKIFFNTDWKAFPDQSRTELLKRFINHSDPVVRNGALDFLGSWIDQDTLIRLVNDTDSMVRMGAVLFLRQSTPPSPEAAATLWRRIEYDLRTSDALEAYVRHERPEKAIPRLSTVANDIENTEWFRAIAVSLLEDFRATKEIKSLLRFLKDEPPVTWFLHTTLLDAAYKLEITPPSLSHLRDVDNADLQYAIAPFMT